MNRCSIALLLLTVAVSLDAQSFDRLIPPMATDSLPLPLVGSGPLTRRQIIVGDFDGDNLDDLFWDEEGPDGYRIGVLKAVGDGTFSKFWTAKNPPYLSDASNYTNTAGGRYLTGKFYGGTQAELLQYDDGMYQLWSFLPGAIYPVAGRYGVLGEARLLSNGESTRFVAGRFDPTVNADVLLSFELLQNGQMARLQWKSPNSDDFVERWNNASTPQFFGGWYFNWGQDEFFAGDFIPGNGTDELLCINRTNGWMKIMRFDGKQWHDLYANYGSYEVYPAPTSGFKFKQSTRVLVGNFDTTDRNAEIVFYDPSEELVLHSFEFDPTTLTFRAERQPARDATGLERLVTTSAPPVRAYERWSTPRYCVSRFLGICFHYVGGQQIQQERAFYTQSEQSTNLELVAGNFFNNGWAIPWNRDILVFRKAVLHVPDLVPNSVFYTSCDHDNMYSGHCPSPVSLYNILGQLLNRFDPATGWFEKRIAPTETMALYSAAAGSNF